MQNKPVGIIVEKEDEIKIIYPKDLEEVEGLINITGKADKNFEFVEIQVDLNGWKRAHGITEWSYLLDLSNLEQGTHIIYARASDGIKYSKIKAVRIKIV